LFGLIFIAHTSLTGVQDGCHVIAQNKP